MEVVRLVENLLLMVWCWYQHPVVRDQELLPLFHHNLIRYSPVWLVPLTLVKVGLFEVYIQFGHPLAKRPAKGPDKGPKED